MAKSGAKSKRPSGAKVPSPKVKSGRIRLTAEDRARHKARALRNASIGSSMESVEPVGTAIGAVGAALVASSQSTLAAIVADTGSLFEESGKAQRRRRRAEEIKSGIKAANVIGDGLVNPMALNNAIEIAIEGFPVLRMREDGLWMVKSKSMLKVVGRSQFRAERALQEAIAEFSGVRQSRAERKARRSR